MARAFGYGGQLASNFISRRGNESPTNGCNLSRYYSHRLSVDPASYSNGWSLLHHIPERDIIAIESITNVAAVAVEVEAGGERGENHVGRREMVQRARAL